MRAARSSRRNCTPALLHTFHELLKIVAPLLLDRRAIHATCAHHRYAAGLLLRVVGVVMLIVDFLVLVVSYAVQREFHVVDCRISAGITQNA